MTVQLKILCAALVLAVWLLLAVLDLTPVAPFVGTLRDILVALGVVGVAAAKQP